MSPRTRRLGVLLVVLFALLIGDCTQRVSAARTYVEALLADDAGTFARFAGRNAERITPSVMAGLRERLTGSAATYAVETKARVLETRYAPDVTGVAVEVRSSEPPGLDGGVVVIGVARSWFRTPVVLQSSLTTPPAE